jgi:hypothetical protein
MSSDSASVRHVVTSVISTPKGGSQVTVSREMVPHREEVFRPEDVSSPAGIATALHRVQQHAREATQATRSLPVLGGTYWPGVSLTANVPKTIAHGVGGGVSVAVLPTAPSAAARIWVPSQTPARGQVTVESDATVTVDLWIYPKPGATR